MSDEMTKSQRRWPYLVLGFILILIITAATILLIEFWPSESSKDIVYNIPIRLAKDAKNDNPNTDTKIDVKATLDTKPKDKYGNVLGIRMPAEEDSRIIIIVLLAGIIGSCIHAMTSFSTFIGNRNEKESWLWWYYLRPFIGGSLALIFYCLIRGGFLAANTNSDNLNLYGVVAVSGLVGMFSKQATDKLREIFDNLFKTQKGKGDDERKDKVEGNKPVKDVMIPFSKIEPFQIKKCEDGTKILLSVLRRGFNELKVTRLPIVNENDPIRYITINKSILDEFILNQCKKSTKTGEEKEKEISSLTLKNLLDDPDFKKSNPPLIMAFISPDAALSDAKAAIEKVKYCKDVFVTEKGTKDEKLMGWLTDEDIAKLI